MDTLTDIFVSSIKFIQTESIAVRTIQSVLSTAHHCECHRYSLGPTLQSTVVTLYSSPRHIVSQILSVLALLTALCLESTCLVWGPDYKECCAIRLTNHHSGWFSMPVYVLATVLRPRLCCSLRDRASVPLGISKAKAVQIIAFACLQAVVLMFVTVLDHPTLYRLDDFGSHTLGSTSALSNLPSHTLRIAGMITQASGKSTYVRICLNLCVSDHSPPRSSASDFSDNCRRRPLGRPGCECIQKMVG